MWKCLFNNFDNTFKKAGAIGDFLYEPKSLSKVSGDVKKYRGIFQEYLNAYFGRFIFDNLFYFAFVVISLSMFSGIIIDKFR